MSGINLDSEERAYEDLLLLPSESTTQERSMNRSNPGEGDVAVGEKGTLPLQRVGAGNENGGSNSEGSAQEIEFPLEDLFGPLFVADTTAIEEPALFDTRSLLQAFFGSHLREEDVDFGDENIEKLKTEMRALEVRVHLDTVRQVFGETGAAVLETQPVKQFNCLLSTMPEPQDVGPYEEMWLADMPKIAPNRQTLHMDPRPFQFSAAVPLISSERKLYTMQNVIRWAYHSSTKKFMSNARVVRWSDGSVTLHVGSDLFTLQDSKENALTMLATPFQVSMGDSSVEAMVSVVNPDRHFVVECNSAASIEDAVIEESQRLRSVSAHHNLAYSVRALPNVNWEMSKRPTNPEDEYVENEYRRRKKMIEQRKREGRPMTLTEQMVMENELLERLKRFSAKDLLEKQQEEMREAALHSTRQNEQPSRRRRLERNVNLEGGDYPGDESNDDDNYLAQFSDRLYNDDNEDEDEDEDYETMLENMRRKRQREDEEADEIRMRRIQERQEAQVARYRDLMDSLAELLPKISENSNSRDVVQGTLDFLATGAFSSAVICQEVPLMLQSVSEEFPDLDLTRVQTEMEKLLAH